MKKHLNNYILDGNFFFEYFIRNQRSGVENSFLDASETRAHFSTMEKSFVMLVAEEIMKSLE